MISKLGQFYRCVRPVPKVQLLRRLQLSVKRRWNTSSAARRFRRRSSTLLDLQDSLPERCFAPRRHLVHQNSNGGFELHQLGDSFSLETPLDWRLDQNHKATHLQRLALHYHEAIESLPFENALQLVLDWIEQNPPYSNGYWLDSWNGYAISLRCICWMQWIAENRNAFQRSDLEIILASLVEQVRFLRRNLETDIGGNHLVKNIKCLIWAGVFFEGKEPQIWSKLGRDLLARQLDVQLLGDGMHYELSPAYHCQVFADLVECAQLLDEAERKLLMDRLVPSAQVISDLTHPDGYISLMSDGGLHMTYSPRDCLLAFESLGGKVSAMSTAFTFKDSGYCGSRFERTYFLADCGPLCADALPAHGHADMLSFEWDIDGQRCIVDAGVYEYEPGHWRALNRSAESHNTVVIGNQDQCELIGSFRIGRRSHANTVLDKWEKGTRLIGGQHSAYRQGIAAVKHRREFQVRESDLVVSDELSVQGKADGNPEEAVARLLLSHEVRVLEANEHRIDLSLSGTRFAVTSSAKMRLRPFHWSPNFGQMYETFQIELIYGPIPCSGKFHLRILE